MGVDDSLARLDSVLCKGRQLWKRTVAPDAAAPLKTKRFLTNSCTGLPLSLSDETVEIQPPFPSTIQGTGIGKEGQCDTRTRELLSLLLLT